MFYFANIFYTLFSEALIYYLLVNVEIELNGYWLLFIFILLYICSAIRYHEERNINKNNQLFNK